MTGHELGTLPRADRRGGPEIDFDEHIDTARLWWDLDEVVLRAIAEGESTAEAFGLIARYVLQLKEASNVPEGEEDTSALTKIAVRLAAAPPNVRTRPFIARHPRRPNLRSIAIAMLITIAAMALLTAAAAADLVPLPDAIRRTLEKVGVHIESNTGTTDWRAATARPGPSEPTTSTLLLSPLADVMALIKAAQRDGGDPRATIVPASGRADDNASIRSILRGQGSAGDMAPVRDPDEPRDEKHRPLVQTRDKAPVVTRNARAQARGPNANDVDEHADRGVRRRKKVS